MKMINFFGEPSAGKSTAMLGLTYYMKLMGLSVENTPEFFKELIYEESDNAKFGGQLHILDQQNLRQARLIGKNDFTVSDCPLPLIGYYTDKDYINGFHDMVTSLFNQYDNVNYYILRNHEFENEKRNHTEEQADKIAVELPLYLRKHGIELRYIMSGPDLVERVLTDLKETNIITAEHLSKSRNQDTKIKMKI